MMNYTWLTFRKVLSLAKLLANKCPEHYLSNTMKKGFELAQLSGR